MAFDGFCHKMRSYGKTVFGEVADYRPVAHVLIVIDTGRQCRLFFQLRLYLAAGREHVDSAGQFDHLADEFAVGFLIDCRQHGISRAEVNADT